MKKGKLLLLAFVLAAGCAVRNPPAETSVNPSGYKPAEVIERPPLAEIQSIQIRRALESAQQQLKITTGYSQGYFTLDYPGGDPPAETGACTDVIIRAFRAAGIDLQKEVHEDMTANFNSYPRKWGLSKTDKNIDHRRVPNLQTYFERVRYALPAYNDPSSFKPGDVVSWDLDGKGMTHIGLISNMWNEKTKRYLIIHNIGSGARAEDRLFEWKITGHFRLFD